VITAKEMHDAATDKCACDKALAWLASLPSHSNPLDYEHSKKAEWATWYAHFVIKGRWSEAEQVIATSPEWAYFYAHFVIKGRWSEAEPVIATSPECAYVYARDVIKGRWPEGEAAIFSDIHYAKLYSYQISLM